MAGSALVAGVAAADTDTRWQRGFDRWADIPSPVARTASDLSAGSAIYRERCQPCHGERGRGDGPAGAALAPRPADLVLHVPQHTDGELYYFVSLGVPGTAMPAWRTVLSERERWQVVLYLRELAGP